MDYLNKQRNHHYLYIIITISLFINTYIHTYMYTILQSNGMCTRPKPGMFDMAGNAKWSAWKNLGEMSQLEAKKLYAALVDKLLNKRMLLLLLLLLLFFVSDLFFV
jgi:acyl-CoA-binding protein